MLGLSLALLFTIGCGGGGGGSTDEKVAIDLIVQQVLPTNGQEVLNDLSAVDGLIQVKFSETVNATSILDPNNAFNGLTCTPPSPAFRVSRGSSARGGTSSPSSRTVECCPTASSR